MSVSREVATFGAGCFWCVEASFNQLRGVESAVSGYSGGHAPNPTYQQVCTGQTGHAEVVQVTFDPAVISFDELLEVFFALHDPTTLNRQGADVGTQYRSEVFCHSPAQRTAAQHKIAELNAAKIWDSPIVTRVSDFTTFYPAEDYHQGYFLANPVQPYCQSVVSPKVAKFRQKFAAKLKSS